MSSDVCCVWILPFSRSCPSLSGVAMRIAANVLAPGLGHGGLTYLVVEGSGDGVRRQGGSPSGGRHRERGGEGGGGGGGTDTAAATVAQSGERGTQFSHPHVRCACNDSTRVSHSRMQCSQSYETDIYTYIEFTSFGFDQNILQSPTPNGASKSHGCYTCCKTLALQ